MASFPAGLVENTQTYVLTMSQSSLPVLRWFISSRTYQAKSQRR